MFAASFLHLALDVFNEISVNHIVPIRWIKSDRCNAYYKLQPTVIVYLYFCITKSSSKKALGATSKRDSTISYVQICFDPITEYLDMYYPSIQHCYP